MKSSLILSVVTFGWLVSALLYMIMVIFRRERFGKLGTLVSFLVLCLQTIGILLRWKESYDLGIGHAPLSNLYESLVFGAWAIMVIYLLLEYRSRFRSFGVIPSLLAFLAMAYASFSPRVDDRIQPLVPALKSNWLIAHVITCFLGYAAFAVSFGLSLIFLARKKFEHSKLLEVFPAPRVIEDLNYRVVMFGFIWLTLGIITGSIWANSAWGSYWSWDPKETWSLITWLVYAALLHARAVRNWRGTRVAWFSIAGFCCVLFTYFGVNFLLSGLHSYATK
ncbi:c-type cytochrome biogenesis protein CcsB [Thermodesulforhabdus norvegica]|uniref:Heme exporter protein C n=1 Tax=Thermodesulforhabdus norvegica TaxID=39841 RepID=A0A1I4SAD6_9BACT|nr:c-type cytochrome biogenesis protein CcsB [Thermodesulforhabdus norvegica]SFM61311.1 cytochrome c-type biogenesis protein CcsB [Thermodesulforhabdus norvegica]